MRTMLSWRSVGDRRACSAMCSYPQNAIFFVEVESVWEQWVRCAWVLDHDGFVGGRLVAKAPKYVYFRVTALRSSWR